MKFFWQNQIVRLAVGVIAAGVALAIGVAVFGPLSLLQSLRIVFSYIYLLIVPGLTWSYVLIRQQKILLLERVVLGAGLSIAMIPLLLFAFRQVGVPITALNIFWEVLLLTGIGLGIVIKTGAGLKHKASHQ